MLHAELYVKHTDPSTGKSHVELRWAWDPERLLARLRSDALDAAVKESEPGQLPRLPVEIAAVTREEYKRANGYRTTPRRESKHGSR